MKELSIEEKAKRYDKAINTIRNLVKAGLIYEDAAIQVFSELKESEDERIRKGLIEACKKSIIVGGFHKDKVIAWLEKQGNLVKYYEDKLDRCACNNFNKGYKKALEKQGENEDKDIETKLNHAHFEGEIEGRDKVLANPEKYGLQKPSEKVESKFKIGDTITDPTDSRFTFHINAIKDGKYMESDIDWVLINKADSDYELVEQKPAWTKWDEERYLSCLKKLSTGNIEQPETVNTVWFKSLKDRVFPQPQQKWSEKDKGNLLDVKCIVDEVWHNQDVREVIGYSVVDLKSLWHWLDNIWQRVEYPNDTWKPSDSQIECLSDAIKHYNSQGYTAPVLKELLEQLKKLREE